MLVSINKFTFERIPRFLMNELPFTVNLVSLHLPLVDYLSHWEIYRAILTRELFLLIAFSHVLPVPAIVSKLKEDLKGLRKKYKDSVELDQRYIRLYQD